ncbi:hypothetical protein PVL30_000979 [Lodderomyces elongisporus]|uniref:uncharacterized protein n=1 Tax=Lodderomyces elongisporus TaxID=36914 RepID=UPI00292029D7|nr:uncharacterized protein PVL30_000979 [Lodderomyces elongisporus]WLF77267.1 hypothetical protein PVL30_000979 [Lodderomyces elongisporus]
MSEVKPRKQASRKGKKAWRKNVDIEDIESTLQQKRDAEIVHGPDHKEEDDFVIDTTPLPQHISKAPKQKKKSKSKEVLENKSKVPALINTRTKTHGKTVQGVQRTEMLRLIKMRGGKYGEENIALARVEEDGLINGGGEDLWDEQPSVGKDTKIPKYNRSTAEVTRATTVPKTLREKPIQISKNDLTLKHVHAGKSYNPSLESWKSLIDQEYQIVEKLEVNRQAMEEHRLKIRELMVTLKDNEVSDDDDSDDEDDDDKYNDRKEDENENGVGEGEGEGEVGQRKVNEESEKDYSLSINKPNKIKIKTKTKRNKEARHKKRMQLEQEIKELKKQLHDLSKLDEILQKQKEEEEEKADGVPPSKKQRSEKKNKLFKYTPIETPLEVKLSDELTSNLKNLKPEGNLFYDQMLNLQSSGKIESRVPVNKKRKYAKKVTEKWTYKDFK